MAGGPITVTDRISVRVSAKTQEQSAANKKAVGGAIGKTLGNEDISDELKTQLGNTQNPVVYDEDGNAWISMEDIIAAGRTMKENGAFVKKSYRYGNVACVPLDSLGSIKTLFYTPGSPNQPVYYGPVGSGEDRLVYMKGPTYVAWVHDINYDSYTFINSGGTISKISPAADSYFNEYGELVNWVGNSSLTSPSGGSVPITDVGKTLLSLSEYGDYHEEEVDNPIIDWAAPNAEVERQIKELHETWDVTDHPGAVTANGTYVLAGPIEFNDGD